MTELQICEIVPSHKGKIKLNVDGYLMVKNTNRGDLYYWCCEYRKAKNCNGFANTVLIGGQHHLRSTKEHNHAPDATRALVETASAEIKKRARETDSAPAAIIRDVKNSMPEGSQSSLPTRQALSQVVKRVRKQDMPSQPTNLENIDVPLNLRTVGNENFLARDSFFNNERILLFTTVSNLEHLKVAQYWIMDGTFKIVPTIFRQLYSIHAPVGTGENAKVLPLVYALMSSKSEEIYTRMFQELNDYANDNNIILNPKFIITDFEKASINASGREFPSSINKGCLFHFGQNIWRKIQEVGLAGKYGSDIKLSLKLRHLVALAFVPSTDIARYFDTLKPEMPENTKSVVTWFEETYVHGRVRVTLRSGNQARTAPLFPPSFWSVKDQVDLNIPRTQNLVEAWHRRINSLVCQKHIGVYKLIQHLTKEQGEVNARIQDIITGRDKSPKKRDYIDREKRLKNVINDYENRDTLTFLKGIAKNIKL
jgi:hypothetical protein